MRAWLSRLASAKLASSLVSVAASVWLVSWVRTLDLNSFQRTSIWIFVASAAGTFNIVQWHGFLGRHRGVYLASGGLGSGAVLAYAVMTLLPASESAELSPLEVYATQGLTICSLLAVVVLSMMWLMKISK